MVFFTSDLHFGHANIIKHCSRPYSCLQDMTDALVVNWNRKVKPTDSVYIVGDMFFEEFGDPTSILSQLNGKKHLIVGNHDNRWLKYIETDKYFDFISPYLEISESCRRIALCHYPMFEWGASRHGSLLVFGHVHNKRDGDDYDMIASRYNMLNAGVDINGYEPVNLRELIINNTVWKTDDTVKRAEMAATLLHAEQKDKAGIPYIEHPRHVAAQVSGESEKAVAWLHDTIEDCGMSKKLLSKAFSSDITDAVYLLTRRGGEDYFDYVRRIKQNSLAAAVKLADLTHNMDISRITSPDEKDILRLEKYKTAYDILKSCQ